MCFNLTVVAFIAADVSLPVLSYIGLRKYPDTSFSKSRCLEQIAPAVSKSTRQLVRSTEVNQTGVPDGILGKGIAASLIRRSHY